MDDLRIEITEDLKIKCVQSGIVLGNATQEEYLWANYRFGFYKKLTPLYSALKRTRKYARH